MRKLDLKMEELEEFYLKRGWSLKRVANELGARSPNTVATYLRKFGFVVRPSDRKDYHRVPFSGNLKEKAYIIGLRTGDLYARKENRLVCVETTSTHEAQLKMFRRTFEKYGNVSDYKKKGGLTEITNRIYAYLDGSFDFIINKPEEIPHWIMNNEALFFSFLSGYCDSEAAWIITQHSKYRNKLLKDLVFSLGTCDKKVLEQIHQKLLELGFNSHLHLVEKAGTRRSAAGVHNFDMWRVMIGSKRDVARLARILLPLSFHDEKLQKMAQVVKVAETLLPKKKLGTVSLFCVHCGYDKIWKDGFKRGYKGKVYRRYKCPTCKKEILDTQITRSKQTLIATDLKWMREAPVL